MTKTELQEKALNLSALERFELAQTLFASVPAEEELEIVPVYDLQRQALDDALEDLRKNPDAGRSWEEVRKELWPEA